MRCPDGDARVLRVAGSGEQNAAVILLAAAFLATKREDAQNASRAARLLPPAVLEDTLTAANRKRLKARQSAHCACWLLIAVPDTLVGVVLSDTPFGVPGWHQRAD